LASGSDNTRRNLGRFPFSPDPTSQTTWPTSKPFSVAHAVSRATLTIEGDPSVRTHFFSLASFTRPASMEEHVRSANVATAMQLLNAVPAVCDAAPGFATTASLPLVRSRVGFGNA
jgi:hypothetical protein